MAARESRTYKEPYGADADPAGVVRRLKAVWSRTGSELKLVILSFSLIALLLSVAFVVLQIKTYVTEEQSAAIKLARVTSSYALLLSEPMKDGDEITIRRLLATIVADASFIGASVLDDRAETIMVMGEEAAKSARKHVREQKITYSDGGGIITLGALVVRGSEDHFREIWLGRANEHIATLVLLSIGLGIAVNLSYRMVIGRPLRVIMEAVQLSELAGPPRPIALDPGDDVGRLAGAIDRYRDNEWNQALALKLANKRLEDIVAARTRELRVAMEELVSKNEEVERIANCDFLTGLPNRRAFIRELDEAIANAGRQHSQFHLLLLDLDNFKTINDTFGHPTGDALLKSVADRITDLLGEGQSLARLGGDEFAIIVPTGSKGGANTRRAGADWSLEDFSDRLIDVLNRAHSAMGKVVHSGCSIGVAKFPDDAATSSDLMAYADIALHRAKSEGRNRCSEFSEEMRRHLHLHDRIEADLRVAISQNALEVHYQPQICLADGGLVGVEALLRWNHPELGPVSPQLVFGVAQERNLVPAVSRLLLRRIIADLGQWLEAGFDPGRVSINVHPNELGNESHIQSLIDTVLASGFAAERFRWEMTEDCLIGRDNAVVQRSLDRFVAAGFTLSLDDFGTGYASLKHLRELPIAEIKIDRSFINNVTKDTNDVAVVATVVHLANQLGLDVVAEGIETEQQLGVLGANAQIIGQGYLLGRPCPASMLGTTAQSGTDLIKAAGPLFEGKARLFG